MGYVELIRALETGPAGGTFSKCPLEDIEGVLNYISLKTISTHSFDGLKGVKRIEIAQSISVETIETEAFNNLLNVSEISIQNTRSLVHIHKRAFNHLPKLRYL
ncbi:hypothetical protein cypCar_00022536 [Cyprinus carpio]|nr:hypothetical protein cypCar_00022536 [Cyprinus carpio]